MIELVSPLTEPREDSPLARARLARQLTRDEAAKRAGIAAERIEWLEEGRVYRFPDSDEALTTLLVYAASLGVEHREARELAGLPVPPKPLERSNRGRLLGVGALAAAVVALAAFVSLPGASDGAKADAFAEVAATLPPPWKIRVEVLNGAGDINWTRRMASRIGALAYTIDHVGRADRFDYQETAVYFEPGGREIAIRLARQLRVRTRPLPGGTDARHLIVIVGPQRGPGQ